MIFRADIVAYETDVVCVVKVPLEQQEFDALASSHYTINGITKESPA